MINYKDLQEQELTEKLDDRKAEQSLKDFQKLYAQLKFVGIDATIEKEMKQVYDRIGSKWFGSNELKRRGIPSSLK